jgi:hypothetical protein
MKTRESIYWKKEEKDVTEAEGANSQETARPLHFEWLELDWTRVRRERQSCIQKKKGY